jgi:hypothetical protein
MHILMSARRADAHGNDRYPQKQTRPPEGGPADQVLA